MIGILNKSRIERVLDFLDGETSLDNLIVFATTNYPEQLTGNLVDRPRRFDKVYLISDPDEESRKLILEFFLNRPVTDNEIAITIGFSAADLKEAAILNRVQGVELSDAVTRIKEHQNLVEKQFAERTPIGIRADFDY